MANTSTLLNGIESHLDESMGVRPQEANRPRLAPVASVKDIGRRRLHNVGSISIDRVVPDPKQPRTEFSEDAIRRLATSIRAKGQLMPIHVRWCEVSEQWIILSGERRWRATKAAGLETINCVFVEDELAESERLEQQLVENLLREDLRPIEEARAFDSLMKLNSWTGNQVAEALNVPASKVSRSLALLDLPEDIQDQVDGGQLAARAAYEVSRLPDSGSRRELASRATSQKLTTREVAAEAKRQGGKRKVRRKPGGVKLTFAAENGWKVSVSSKGKGNYHEVAEALQQALDEVQIRIDSRIEIF